MADRNGVALRRYIAATMSRPHTNGTPILAFESK
jgi:hypothetical protein